MLSPGFLFFYLVTLLQSDLTRMVGHLGATLGMLTVEGLIEVADDAPLIHSREAMVDELVRTFTARLAGPGNG